MTALAGPADVGVDVGSVVDRSAFGGPSARYIATGLLLAVQLLAGASGSAVGLGTLVGTGLVLLTFDKRNPVSLRNFFVVYTVALFCFGVPFFDLSPGLYADMTLFVVVFLCGYAISSVRQKHAVEAPVLGVEGASVMATRHRIRVVEEVMLVLVCCQVLFLAFNISRYGLTGFYSGQGLIYQLQSYGKASVSGGLVQIVTFVLKYTTIAVVITYVMLCLRGHVKVRYRYLLLLLVGMPIMLLARSDALHGAGLLVIINAAARRFERPIEGVGGSLGATASVDASADLEGRLAPRRTFSIAFTMIVAIVAGLVIGSLRQAQFSRPTAASRLERSVPLLTSEFSPIQAYSEIKANSELLGRQYGATIGPPIIFKVLPRGFFPNKPKNSGAYYMSVVHPAGFAAGFALPPTLFGDAHLNFGMWGAVMACLLVGMVAARLDGAYKRAQLSRLPWFLIVYANFYALVRSPLAETLAGIILTAAVWAVISHVLGARTPRPALQPATT